MPIQAGVLSCFANPGANPVKELLDHIKKELHEQILIIPIFQPPLECDLLMEVYFSISPEWKRSMFLHSSGGVILFERNGLSVSNGYALSNAGDCVTDSNLVFKTLQQLLDKTGFEISDITRQWNYIEGILSNRDQHQNYQIFNDARTDFYHGHFKEKGYPAATGIGMKKGGVLIEYIAVKGERIFNVPIDNPQQIPAHKYHEGEAKLFSSSEKPTLLLQGFCTYHELFLLKHPPLIH